MLNFVVSSPVFIAMLPLAGLPVLFHLFLKVRKRSLPFSTLMFFQHADPRMSARKRIREWLILLLRTLLIAFLLLALARPVWLGTGTGGDVAHVLLIDNSGSMAAPAPDGNTRLYHALAAARALVGHMDDGDTAALVTLVQDPAVLLPEGLTRDRAVLRAALGRIEATHASGNPGMAMNRAFALLRKNAATRGEVHVFSDLQTTEWGQGGTALPARPAGTWLALHRIESREFNTLNAAVTGIRLPDVRLVAGRPASADITLLNTTTLEAGLRLNISDSSGTHQTRHVALPARGTATVTVPFSPDTPGRGWIKAWIDEDGLTTDNEAYLACLCSARERVVFAGQRETFGLLPAAVAPSGTGALSGLVPEVVPHGDLHTGPGASRPAMIAATWPLLSEHERVQENLETYVATGGVLLLLPRLEPDGAAIEAPSWTGASPGSLARHEAGSDILVFDKSNALWHDARDEQGEPLVRTAIAFLSRGLTLSKGATALLGLEDGTVLLSHKPHGKGKVLACGLAFTSRWSTLPLKGAFVAMAQNMALLQPGPEARLIQLTAGERLPESGMTGPVEITTLQGPPVERTASVQDLYTLPRAGVYVLQPDGAPAVVAVASAPGEGQQSWIHEQRVPAMGALPHHVLPYEDPESMLREIRRNRTGFDLLVPFLCLAMAALLGEGLLANPRPMARARTGRQRHRAPAGDAS